MRKILSILVILTAVIFSSCDNNYSVFNGGTGGLIVDAESTSIPKRGIANVDVYAYTSSGSRDSDFNNWREGTVFSPSDSYYGHTSTDANGSFVISNIVWKEKKPDFGKDADFTTIYLLYFHENYGLTKDQTVITSDSTSDTVYAELTTIKKTTSLNISIIDVSNPAQATADILVRISVPQNTDSLNAAPKLYEQLINGSGIINITYPRWKNVSDRTNKIENTPQINISYAQSADNVHWKACANGDNATSDYAFLPDNFSVTKTVQNNTFNISLYGKATRIALPTVNGTYGTNDGVIISMKAKDSEGNYTIDCGETSTFAQTVGSSNIQTHGHFSGLGAGFFITDSQYTGRYKTIDVEFYTGNSAISGSQRTLRSDIPSYNLSL